MQGCSPEVPSDPSGWNKSRRGAGPFWRRGRWAFWEGCIDGVEDSGKLHLEAAVVSGQAGRWVRVRGKVKQRNKNQGKRKRTKKDDIAKTESVQSSQGETTRTSSQES